MHGENNMETYITICKINSQWEFAIWLRKLKQGLCIHLEGWNGAGDGGMFKREGIYVYPWLIRVEVWVCSLLWYVGFSLRRLLLLQNIGCKYTGFSSCGSWAQLLCGRQNLPGPGIEPSSPALAGRFLSPTKLFLNET